MSHEFVRATHSGDLCDPFRPSDLFAFDGPVPSSVSDPRFLSTSLDGKLVTGNQDSSGDRTSPKPLASPFDAISAIEIALATLENDTPTVDQLGDLADAIDAYAEGSYFVAKALASAALRSHRRATGFTRPSVRELSEVKRVFESARRKLDQDASAGSPTL